MKRCRQLQQNTKKLEETQPGRSRNTGTLIGRCSLAGPDSKTAILFNGVRKATNLSPESATAHQASEHIHAGFETQRQELATSVCQGALLGKAQMLGGIWLTGSTRWLYGVRITKVARMAGQCDLVRRNQQAGQFENGTNDSTHQATKRLVHRDSCRKRAKRS